MKYGFGVDVGGTTVKLGLLSEAGELLEKWELPSRTENGGENILPDIARSVQDCMARRGLSRDDCLGLGFGVPGPVDASGMVNRCVNLNWGVFNLHDALGILTGLRVRAGNDANCAALGEFWMGGGSGCRSAIFVTLGTGIGGGVIVDGRLLTGAHGVGGELGHIEISAPDKAPCTCGKARLRRAVCLGERHRPRDEKTPCRIGRAVLPACDGALCLQGRVRRRPQRRRLRGRNARAGVRLSGRGTGGRLLRLRPGAHHFSAAACPARATTCCAASSAISARTCSTPARTRSLRSPRSATTPGCTARSACWPDFSA